MLGGVLLLISLVCMYIIVFWTCANDRLRPGSRTEGFLALRPAQVKVPRQRRYLPEFVRRERKRYVRKRNVDRALRPHGPWSRDQ